MNNPCKHAERQIQLLIDGRLSPAERSALDRHLSACPSCGGLLDDYRTVSLGITRWTAPTTVDDPGDVFNAAVLRSLALPTNAPARQAWPSLAAAAALIGCAAALWQLTSPGRLLIHSFDLLGRTALQIGRLPTFPTIAVAWPPLDWQQMPQWNTADLIVAAALALTINAWFIYRTLGGRRVAAR